MTVDARQVATFYVGLGWAPVPIPPRSKSPIIKGWHKMRARAIEVPKYFEPGCNVGVLLGEPSKGLVDVDLDCPEAVQLAPQMLPPTDAVFGRASSPGSHRLYVAPGAKTIRCNDGRDTLVELRSTGGQTVFPGSVHPSGEEVRWEQWGEPAEVDAGELADAVKRLAEAARLVRQGFAPELAAALAIEGRVEDKREPPRRKRPVDGAFKEAVSSYNRDHRRDFPRNNGTCPGCGHNGCFGAIPDTEPPRWYCFSSGHVAPGIQGRHGYHGDALDLDAHAVGMTRAELLKEKGYLEVSQPVPSPLKKGEKRRVKQVVLRRVEDLKPPEGWLSTAKQATISAIAESLKHEGLRQPIVIVSTGHIVHGVHRWAAAQEAGLNEVECVVEDQSASQEEHEAKVIAENLVRRHFSASEVEKLTRRLTQIRAQELTADEKPNENSICGQSDQQLPREEKPKAKKAGRPKSPKRRAIEKVAKETGQTPEAVRQKIKRAESDLRPTPPPAPKKPKPTPPPEGVPAELTAEWLLLTQMAEENDRLLRQVQSNLKRTLAKMNDNPRLVNLTAEVQAWREDAHTLGHAIRTSAPVSLCLWCKGAGQGCRACQGAGIINKRVYESASPEMRGEAPTAKEIMEAIS